MKGKGFSLSARIAAWVTVAVSALYILSTVILTRVTDLLLEQEATKSAADMLTITSARVDQILKSVESKTISVSWIARESLRNDKELYTITRRFVEESPEIVGSAIALGDTLLSGRKYFSPYSWRDGEVIRSKQLGNDDYNYFKKDWFLPFTTRKPAWSEPYHDMDGGEKLMTTFSFPITGNDKEPLAVITADIEIGLLNEIIDSLQLGNESHTILTSQSGTIVAADLDTGSNNDFITIFDIADSLHDNHVMELAQSLVNGETGTTVIGPEPSDKVMVSYGKLSNGWSISVYYPYREVMATTVKMRRIVIPISLLGILLMGVLIGFIIKRLLSPLKSMTESVEEIASGNFDTALPEITRKDEIRQLRDSFSNMQASLKDYIEDLKVSTAANEKYSNELQIASAIQGSVLRNDFPKEGNLDIFARIIPAKEVGGDLYDFCVKDGKLFFAIGDVSGKGIPASIHMALAMSAFRLTAGLIDTGHVIAKINNNLSENNPMGVFVTLFLACLDLETGVMRFCNAGHNPLVLIDPQGKASFLETKPNLAAGLVNGFRYESQEIRIEKGTKLILYTDGVTEAENESLELFGSKRLISWAESIPDPATAESISTSLIDAVKSYAGNFEQNDDITVMTVIYK